LLFGATIQGSSRRWRCRNSRDRLELAGRDDILEHRIGRLQPSNIVADIFFAMATSMADFST